jgi:hypothetical protein
LPTDHVTSGSSNIALAKIAPKMPRALAPPASGAREIPLRAAMEMTIWGEMPQVSHEPDEAADQLMSIYGQIWRSAEADGAFVNYYGLTIAGESGAPAAMCEPNG